MSFLTALHDRIDDSMNPIVVKELRQAVQGKFITGILILFLFFQIGTLTFSMIDKAAVSNFDLGRETFIFLMAFVLVASTLAVPVYTGYRFAGERTEIESDLLFITTITPRAIIRGKFLSAMALAMLFYSASMPFMTITYFFRGIDLFSIFALVVFSLVAVCLNVGICIFIACLPLNFALRVVVGLMALIPLLWVFFGSIALTTEFLKMGIGSRIFSSAFWEDFAPGIVLIVFALGLLYVLSVAAISPAPTNRALGIRRYITIFWVLSLGLMFDHTIRSTSASILEIWILFITVLLAGTIPAAVSERTCCGSRVARTIPKGALGRRLAFLFYSGSAGGIAWAVGMILLTQIVPHILLEITGLRALVPTGWSLERERETVLTLSMYVLGYSLLAGFIRRIFFGDRVPVAFTWIMVALVAGIGGALPPILGFVLFGSDDNVWLLGNPFLTFQSSSWRESCLSFSAIFCLVALLLNFRWLKDQWTSFIPLEEQTVQTAETGQAAEVAQASQATQASQIPQTSQATQAAPDSSPLPK